MTPSQTFDPRDQWARARRIEVFRYATELGHTKDNYIEEQMPKDLMVKRLKALGVPAPSVPKREIGANISARSGDTTPNSHHTGQQQLQPTGTTEVDAEDVLERDWKQRPKVVEAKPVADMSITELRKECKARGIKMARTDNMPKLKAKLNGE